MKKYYINKTSTIFLLAFLIASYQAIALIGKYPIKNYTPVDYEAGIQNIDFAQNRDMTLFVANNLGILSFNGSIWKTHAFRTGKKQRSLAFNEKENRLYVGSQGDFGFFENNWEYTSLLDKIPQVSRDFDEVWDVFIQDKYIYFCTFQGIYVYNGDTISVIEGSDGFNKSFFLNNRIFTQNTDGVLFEIKGNSLNKFYAQGQVNQIVAGMILKDNGYLIFYNSGVIEYSSAFGVRLEFPLLSEALKGKYVNHVNQMSDTRLVISTQRAGIFIYDMQTGEIENITVEDGLMGNACLRSFQDYSGNLWVGMQNGIALIDINSPMRLIGQKINLQGSGYEAYDSEEGTYYTTSNGIFFLEKEAKTCVFLEGTEGPAYGMQMINSNLYAGHHTGLFLLKGGKAKRCATTNGLWQIKQLQSNPNYAIGGTYSGLYLFKMNELQELQGVAKIKGFDESSRFFEEDNKGRIWVGQFYKGLYRLTLDDNLASATTKKVSDDYNLPIKKHIILSKVDDEIYIATEQGIYKVDQASEEIVKADKFSQEIDNPWVYLFLQGTRKEIYIYSDNQVGYFKSISPGNYSYVPSSLFQLRHAFNNDLLNVSVNVANGVLFNANEGFIHYNPDLEDRSTIIKEPIISRVYVVDEDSVLFARLPFENKNEDNNAIVITEGLKVLQFMTESFKFNNVGDNRFRYYLKGFDNDFGTWTNSTIKEYTNLKEGKYEFYVQTLNLLGEQITSKPLAIIVEPPFYRSAIMKVVYVILAVLFIFSLYRIQRQYYKDKHRKFEKQKQNELSQKQTELQRLKEEQIQNELSHVNNLLAASTMNLVVKNEFMENIKEELKEVNLKAELSERKVALERIVKEIDKALKLQEDWQQFEHHFDRVHGDFLTRLTAEFTDLTPGEQKLCAFLRLKMDTKEIANLMAISLRGVEVARYRLRKKFGLDRNENLSKFILEY